MKRKHVTIAVRILIAVVAVVYIALALDWRDYRDDEGVLRQGILNTIKSANVTLMLVGAALVGLVYPITTLRWWVLMRARGIDVPVTRAFRLVMVGCFFNYFMPGTTGGDVVKAFYAAKGSGRHADAIMSIVVDRVAGVVGLVILAATVGLFSLDDPVAKQVTLYLGAGLALLVIGAVLYFTRALHKVFLLDRWLHKLPGGLLLKKVDDAAVAYRDHKIALAVSLVLSLAVHACMCTATVLAGKALGISADFAPMVAIVPVLFICAALPISPQGLGTTELLGDALLVQTGMATFNQVVGMLMLWRLYQVAFAATVGPLMLLKGDIHLHPQDEEDAATADDADRADQEGAAAAT